MPHSPASRDNPVAEASALGRVRLRLYVTGGTSRAERTLTLLRRVCDHAYGDAYDLTVIDVLDRPDLAESDRIVATPTLVREFPPPVRRVVGAAGDGRAILQGLELDGGPERDTGSWP